MKDPKTAKTFLDLEEINSILPKDFTLTKSNLGSRASSRGIYTTPTGTLVSISNSKTYPKGMLCWYYVYADRYLEAGVKYMLFTIGMEGLILLPMDAFQPFKKGCGWKEGMNRGEKRYRIDIGKYDGKYFLVNHSGMYEKKLDINSYFIPFQ